MTSLTTNIQDAFPGFSPRTHAELEQILIDAAQQALEKERQQKRPKTYVDKTILESVYGMAKQYAQTTADETVPEDTEGRAGGLLVIIDNWNGLGVSEGITHGSITLPPRIVPRKETYLFTERFPYGVSVSDTRKASLEELAAARAENPHSDAHDWAWFLDNETGDVMSTRTAIQGMNLSELPPEPNGFEGNGRFNAARYYTTTNPFSVAIMVSSTTGNTYVIQEGTVKKRCTLTGDETVYAPITHLQNCG